MLSLEKDMFYEIVRALIQKIFQDKILFALVIIGILAIFVGGFGGGSGERVVPSARQQAAGVNPRSSPDAEDPAASDETKAQPQPAEQKQAAPVQAGLAKDFVLWWLRQAMDYNSQTAIASHQSAFQWMTPEASQAFQSAFWTPSISNAVIAGSIAGGFTPTAVEAIAVNPDGSVVVRVTGKLVLHRAMQQVNADFLVRRETSGLRIAGMYNRSVSIPGSSVY